MPNKEATDQGQKVISDKEKSETLLKDEEEDILKALSIKKESSDEGPGPLQTDNKEKAHRVSKKLRSGCDYINGNAADVGTPFGGYRQSGNGREGGV